MLTLSDVIFDYGSTDFSLRIPKLEVHQGQRVAIVGPSGAGKTSLLHLVSGLAEPVSGTVRFGSRTLKSMKVAQVRDLRALNFGLVFHDFELLDYLSVEQNILLPFRINRRLRLDDTVRERVNQLMHAVGLNDLRSRDICQLSQGERQRVAICRALSNAPRVVLADEPTGNLDRRTAAASLQLILETAAGCDATVIVVTHNDSLLGNFDHIIRFKQIQESDSEAESPRNVWIAALENAEVQSR